MGMLMHHTWLAQQEKPKEKKSAEPVEEPKVEPQESVEEPVKRGRRKISK